MSRNEAKKLSKYHKFTRKELYCILEHALKDLPDNFWSKPSRVNPIFDYGAYFNFCVDIVDYKEGENDNDIVSEVVSFRILHIFGKYSAIQLPKIQKKKTEVKIQKSEKPSLRLKG